MADRKYIVRKWCNKLKDKDIVCLQEIKLVSFQASCINNFLCDKIQGFILRMRKEKGEWQCQLDPNGFIPYYNMDAQDVKGHFG